MFPCAPAVGEPAVGVIPVTQNGVPHLVHLVGDPPIQVEVPARDVVLAVGQALEVAGWIIRVINLLQVRIGLRGFASGQIIAVAADQVELVGVAGWASNIHGPGGLSFINSRR